MPVNERACILLLYGRMVKGSGEVPTIHSSRDNKFKFYFPLLYFCFPNIVSLSIRSPNVGEPGK